MAAAAKMVRRNLCVNESRIGLTYSENRAVSAAEFERLVTDERADLRRAPELAAILFIIIIFIPT